MNQLRELIFYRSYFYDFFDKQPENVKEKIDYVLFLLTHIDRVPVHFLKHLNGYQKKTQKTSLQEIEMANKLMQEYFSTTK